MNLTEALKHHSGCLLGTDGVEAEAGRPVKKLLSCSILNSPPLLGGICPVHTFQHSLTTPAPLPRTLSPPTQASREQGERGAPIAEGRFFSPSLQGPPGALRFLTITSL